MTSSSNIKERLLRRFEPIKDEQGRVPNAMIKIAEVLAEELNHLVTEQQHSENRILLQLQQKLKGQFSNRKKPAHKIIQQYPETNLANELNAEEHFERIDETGQQHFWTPLYDTMIYPVRIAYRYWKGQLWKQESMDKMQWLAQVNPVVPAKENELWLGVQIQEDYILPEQMHLYVSSKALIGKYDIKEIRPLIKINVGDYSLEGIIEPLGNNLPSENILDWKEKQWLLYEVEQPIAKQYGRCFVKIKDLQQIKKISVAPVSEQFPMADQEEQVYWFKLVFPCALDKTIVDNLSIGFNCFPALNRRLRNREETPYQPITTIPLQGVGVQNDNTGREHFLGLQKIFYGSGASFKPAIVNDFGAAKPGEYGLQHGGVVSFNQAEARRQLAYTFQLLERERVIIQSLLGQQLNNGTIRDKLNEISERLSDLRAAIGTDEIIKNSWYLSCKPINDKENILVRWWVSGGLRN